MKEILFATENKAKIKRFSKGLLEKSIRIFSINDLNVKLDIEENGKDAIENAIIKAKAYYEKTGHTTFAMDDNLYIENIPDNMQPGMFVRRVNGKRLTDDEMIEHYTSLARKYGNNGKLTARWIYGIAVIKCGRINTYTWSKDDFYIVDKPSEKINPGYPLNSISINKKLNKYFTDITEEDKVNLKEEETDVIEFISRNV